MRLSTIWSIPGMDLKERFSRTGDWTAMAVAKRLPARVRYWTFIQVGSAAMKADDIVPDVKFMDVLKNVGGGPKS